jgi:hypothetical protein
MEMVVFAYNHFQTIPTTQAPIRHLEGENDTRLTFTWQSCILQVQDVSR